MRFRRFLLNQGTDLDDHYFLKNFGPYLSILGSLIKNSNKQLNYFNLWKKSKKVPKIYILLLSWILCDFRAKTKNTGLFKFDKDSENAKAFGLQALF